LLVRDAQNTFHHASKNLKTPSPRGDKMPYSELFIKTCKTVAKIDLSNAENSAKNFLINRAGNFLILQKFRHAIMITAIKYFYTKYL